MKWEPVLEFNVEHILELAAKSGDPNVLTIVAKPGEPGPTYVVSFGNLRNEHGDVNTAVWELTELYESDLCKRAKQTRT